MNNTVNVSGMEVRTKVNDNLLIAGSELSETSKEADASFKYGYIVTHEVALLEPVSTIDGVSFFYNNTKNVKADGDAVQDTFTAYNHANTDDFNTNYGTTGAVGYVEYVFQLKADNSSDADQDVVLSAVNVIYGTNPDASKAWRAAMFVWDMGVDGSTAAGDDVAADKLVTILAPEDAEYFEDKAVKTATTLDTVSNLGASATVGTVDANTTHFFKVVVRLWLEGEDNTCNNTTFASLTENWAFDLTFTLVAKDADGALLINNTATTTKEVLTSATAADSSATNKIVDGTTYYAITGHNGFYTKVAGAITKDSVIYKIDNNLKVTDVTNQCTLPTA